MEVSLGFRGLGFRRFRISGFRNSGCLLRVLVLRGILLCWGSLLGVPDFPNPILYSTAPSKEDPRKGTLLSKFPKIEVLFFGGGGTLRGFHSFWGTEGVPPLFREMPI